MLQSGCCIVFFEYDDVEIAGTTSALSTTDYLVRLAWYDGRMQSVLLSLAQAYGRSSRTLSDADS